MHAPGSAWPKPPWAWPASLDGKLLAGFQRQSSRQARAGGELVGWKIGGNDFGARARWGVDSCVFGYLTDATCRSGDQTFAIGDAACAAVEPEIWIEVLSDLCGDEPADVVATAIGRLGLAAEIIDLRGRFDDIASVLADNIFHRAATFADPLRLLPVGDLPSQILIACRNGSEHWRLPATTLVADVREVVAFVAGGLARRGDRLAAGQRILSGVLTPLPIWVQPGDQVSLSAGDLGALDLTFTGSFDP
jgi:2-keto-4-pentenoate hydratase